jgi:hypothetical protein
MSLFFMPRLSMDLIMAISASSMLRLATCCP